MTWSFVPAQRDFAQYAHDWDRLNEAVYRAHPLLASRFVGPLVVHFGSERTTLAIHRHGQAIDAMLLLEPGRFKWATFLPSQTQVAPILVAHADAVASLLRALPVAAVALDLLCQDPLYSVVPTLPTQLFQEAAPHATTLNISLAGSFDDYWQARSKKLRQNMRRSLRSIDDAGKRYELVVHEEAQAVQEALHRYAEIESRGWKAKAGTAIRLGDVQGQFYADVVRRFSEVQGVAIYELRLDGQVAASQIGLYNQQMLITLKTTHDEACAAYSPGYVLDYLLLQREFSLQRFAVVEYYTNASPELLRWGTDQRVIAHHRFYKHAWARPMVHALRGLRSAASKTRADAPAAAAPAPKAPD